jgi:hypothetical protein
LPPSLRLRPWSRPSVPATACSRPLAPPCSFLAGGARACVDFFYSELFVERERERERISSSERERAQSNRHPRMTLTRPADRGRTSARLRARFLHGPDARRAHATAQRRGADALSSTSSSSRAMAAEGVFECKKCRKGFASFQEFGAHRTRLTRLQAQMLRDPAAADERGRGRTGTSAPSAGSSCPCPWGRRSAGTRDGTEARRRCWP